MDTHSRWEDSGFDCSLCGGPIFKRIDEGPGGRVVDSAYHCQKCEAVWSLENELLQPGLVEKQYRTAVSSSGRWPWWVWLTAGLVVMFLLLRAGVIGGLLLRYVVPAVFVLFSVWVVWRLGREFEWW